MAGGAGPDPTADSASGPRLDLVIITITTIIIIIIIASRRRSERWD
jgi:hypothetical protein